MATQFLIHYSFLVLKSTWCSWMTTTSLSMAAFLQRTWRMKPLKKLWLKMACKCQVLLCLSLLHRRGYQRTVSDLLELWQNMNEPIL